MKRKSEEEKRAVKRAYQERNKELYRAAASRYRARLKANDPERWNAVLRRQNEGVKEWRKTPKGKAAAQLCRQNRKARLNAAAGSGLSDAEWRDICAKHTDESGRVLCAYCKTPCVPTVDHVVPLSRGGAHDPSNIVPACGPCNSSKRDLLISEWSPKIPLGKPLSSALSANGSPSSSTL